MRIYFHFGGIKRCVSLLLVLAMLLPNFTGIAYATDTSANTETVCGITEHIHAEDCRATDTMLICQLPEDDAHTHEEGCYQQVEMLLCGQEEHIHEEVCYSSASEISLASLEEPEETTAPSESEAATEPSESTETETTIAPSQEMSESSESEGSGLIAGLKAMFSFLMPSAGEPAMASSTGGNANDISGYTKDLIVYNYSYRTNSDHSGYVYWDAESQAFLLQGAFGYNIIVSGQTTDNETLKPMAQNITLNLHGLTVSGTTTIYPVYPEVPSGYKTVLNIGATTALADLVIANGAVAEINMDSALSIQNLNLNGALVINTNGNELTLNGVSGSGSLTITGGINANSNVRVNDTLACGSLTANSVTLELMSGAAISDSLSLNTVSITANKKQVTAKNISAVSTTVQNAELFGASAAVTGEATVFFNNCSFNDVERVGAGDDCMAIVRFAQDCQAQGTVEYVQDYILTYVTNDTADQTGWLKHYRIKSSTPGGAGEILTPNTTLPEYAFDGYEYTGWKLAEDDPEVITDLAGKHGDLTLYLAQTPKQITVNLDIGFHPSADNSDSYMDLQRKYTEISSKGTKMAVVKQAVDSILKLDLPDQFGYTFGGWKMTGGEIITDDSLKLTLDILTDADKYVLALEAVWTRNSFPMGFTFEGQNVPKEMIQVYMGEKDAQEKEIWYPLADFAEMSKDIWTWDSTLMSTKSGSEILYGESMDEYFNRMGKLLDEEKEWHFPVLRDARIVSDDAEQQEAAQSFRTWLYGIRSVSAQSTYDTAGILANRKPAGQTWTEYSNALAETNVVILQSSFGIAEYAMRISAVSGWTYQVNGKTAEPVDGVISVPNGATFTLAYSKESNQSITKWAFSAENGSNLQVTERYTANSSMVYYDMTMPACDVKATYTSSYSEGYIDIAKAPITFEMNVDPNGSGILRNGFWHDNYLTASTSVNCQLPLLGMTPLCYVEGKGYFYIWNVNDKLYITSDGVETTNQLTIVNAMTGVYFNACRMTARESYLAAAVGRRLNGQRAVKAGSKMPEGLKNLQTAEYANIVLSNDNGYQKYTTNLYFMGQNNTVAAIMPSTLRGPQDYCGKLNVYGDSKNSSTLTLGNITYAGKVSVSNLTINQYTDNYHILIHTSTENMQNDGIEISNCKINAPGKMLYCSYEYVNIKNTDFDLESVFAAYYLQMSGSGYGRIRGDVICNYYLIDVSGTCSLVVDGGVYSLSLTDSYGNYSISTSGYVIVKGIGIIGTKLSKNGSGVLLANMITSNRGIAHSAGTTVTNQLLNVPVTAPALDSNDQYYVSAYTQPQSTSNTNDDSYPFYAYSNKQSTTSVYSISGGQLYLLGYYHNTGNPVYDVAHDYAADTANPVTGIIQSLLDSNGDLKSELRSAANATAVRNAAGSAVTASTTQNECVQVGSTKHDADSSCAKTVNISGGKIYAAGNVVFFNDTTISGGEINCNGTLGSKLDMTVQGSAKITAKEVGIAHTVTKAVNGLTRYSKLDLKAGAITADRIGTLSKYAGSTVTPQGVLSLGTGATLATTDGTGNVAIYSDLYANYLYDEDVYSIPDTPANPESLRFSGSVAQGTNLSLDGKLNLEEAIQLTNPKLGEEAAMWLYDDANGNTITGIAKDGKAESAENPCVYKDRDQFAVYAAKSKYALKVDGDYGNGFTVSVNGSQILTANGTAEVEKQATVSLTLTQEQLDNTVVWYTDAAGVLHNLLQKNSIDRNTGTITFVMPYADATIWITKNLNLYLDLYSIGITSSGFAVEEYTEDRRTDSEFTYSGNLVITQEKTAATYNRIAFESADAGNAGSAGTGRRITLQGVKQNTLGILYGITIADGANVQLMINGNNTVAPVHLPYNSAFTMTGTTQDPAENTVYFDTKLSLKSYRTVGSEQCGAVTYENLTLARTGGSYLKFADNDDGKRSDKPVVFRNCQYSTSKYYTYDAMVKNMGDVLLENCGFHVQGSDDINNAFASGCDNLKLVDTELYFSYGGGRGGYHVFQNINGTVEIEDSRITLALNRSSTSTLLQSVAMHGRVTMTGDSEIIADSRLSLISLNMSGNSKVSVSHTNGGHLFCPSITMGENAQIDAAYVHLTGFNKDDAADEAAFRQNMADGKALNGSTYSGLIMTGGTINASEFLGGDVNTSLNIQGGTVNAKRIGTFGALFGYSKLVPVYDATQVYQYAKIPDAGTEVSISGGTVNVLSGGYLGGIRTEVNISGGAVNLAENSALGMTDTQATEIANHYSMNGQNINDSAAAHYRKSSIVNISGGEVTGTGSINTAYGSLSISGMQTGVNVKNITALYGSVVISESAGKYQHEIETSDPAGVYVSDLLRAQNIEIRSNAKVYAATALVQALNLEDKASLDVMDTAKLYVKKYGSEGQGKIEIDDEALKSTSSSRQYAISYNLRDDKNEAYGVQYNDDRDHAKLDENTVYEFTGNDNTTVTLEEPSWYGYEFWGWYRSKEYAAAAELKNTRPVENSNDIASPISEFYTSLTQDVELYAAWKPQNVVFQVRIPKLDTITAEEWLQEYKDLGEDKVNWEGDVLIFNETVSVPYLESIFTEDNSRINTEKYALPSYNVVGFYLVDGETRTLLDPSQATVSSAVLNQFNAAGGSGKIILEASNLAKKRELLTLHLRLDSETRPIDAKFAGNHSGIRLQDRAPIGATIGDAAALCVGGELNRPTATGYTFAGWYPNESRNGTPVTAETRITSTSPKNFYAKWDVNQYKIQFDAAGGVITKTKVEPTAENAVSQLEAYAYYDSAINGGISYEQGQSGANALPVAWKEGYEFLGWQVDGVTLKEEYLNAEELNTTTFPVILNAWNTKNALNTEGGLLLTFTAVYRALTVTYDTDGGVFTDKWTGIISEDGVAESNGTTVGYGIPLAGYQVVPAENGAGYDLIVPVTGAGKTFAVISTTAEYYEGNKNAYVEDDYREDIVRKGYTFRGWYNDANQLVGTLPKYEDIKVTAKWATNEYFVNLHPVLPEQEYSKEYEVREGGDVLLRNNRTERKIRVSIGEPINSTTAGATFANWPGREDWYAKADNSTEKRYLLGFTFNKLNPGAQGEPGSPEQNAYEAYAGRVIMLQNNDALFTKQEGESFAGSIFRLPESSEYGPAVITGTDEVPDYPSGYTIDMYAVYRERSLVFIERYIDPGTEKPVQKVLESVPYSQYSSYPDIYQPDAAFGRMGYTLTKWTVNSYAMNADTYPQGAGAESIYSSKVAGWLQDAKNIGNYDIYVYTNFAAQDAKELTHETNAVYNDACAVTQTYTLPASMGNSRMHYRIIPDGLKLIPENDLDPLAPDRSKEITVKMELVDSDGISKKTIWLDGSVQTLQDSGIDIGAGWMVMLTVYHSSVISADAGEASFDLNMTFAHDDSQKITLQNKVVMVPTSWPLTYKVTLPDDAYWKLQGSQNGFSIAGNTATKSTNWSYGSALESKVPELEGYTANGKWSHESKEEFGYGNNAIIHPLQLNTIVLTTAYVPNQYSLTSGLDDQKWTVSKTGTVNYHESISINPQGSQNAQFVWLKFEEVSYRLDRLTETDYAPMFHAQENNGIYTILMPAGNVELYENDKFTLYLDNGTIDITENGYTQNGKTVSWTGDYVIWQNKNNNADTATANVLNLTGNLVERTIELGSLNISSPDSITLDQGTAELKVTAPIHAKNIQVTETANLTMQSGARTEVVLTPGQNAAAIGGSGNKVAAGTITVNNLKLTLNMPYNSVASGIGAADADSSIGSIVVDNCELIVKEGNAVGMTPYGGTWIGGKNALSVNIYNSTMPNNDSEQNVTIVDGKTVSFSGCNIASAGAPLKNHIIRGDVIYINSSNLYLIQNDIQQGDSEERAGVVLNPGVSGQIHVDENLTDGASASQITITGSVHQLYRGVMKIYSSKSDVTIGGNQILDLANGNIVITNSGVTQDEVPHGHEGSYLLLHEFAKTSDVTVEGLKDNQKITANSVGDTSLAMLNLTVNVNTALVPMGMLTLSGVSIAAGTTLTVSAEDDCGLIPASFDGDGNYVQMGGKLESAADIVVGGNMTLEGVAAKAENKAIGSNGTSGATTVSFTGSTVVADTIGAIGTRGESFTFVEVDNTTKLTGTLVQDHYRLQYHLEDNNFRKDTNGVPYQEDDNLSEASAVKLPTVFWSSCEYDSENTAVTPVYTPEIPAAPEYTGTQESYFSNWYYLETDTKVPLSATTVPGFTGYKSLTTATVNHAEDSASDDGTKTLHLYEWMKINGSGVITHGRQLSMLSGVTAKTTAIETDGAWTARFDVEGVILEGADYQFAFDEELPAGTKLTLRVGTQQPVYYYCIMTEAKSAVNASGFCKMGTNTAADLLGGTVGATFEHVLQLSADFADTSAVANTVALSVVTGTTKHPIDTVDYTVNGAAAAFCTATPDTVTFSVTPGNDSRLTGKHLYLVAELRGYESVPYGAGMTLNGTRSTNWIGGNRISFSLGAYGAMAETTWNWSIDGLNTGTYDVVWHLTAAAQNTQNVFDRCLGHRYASSVTVTEADKPYLDVSMVSAATESVDGKILSAGDTGHTLTFTYVTNASKVQVLLEKQSALMTFASLDEPKAADPVGTEVMIPGEAGVYRVRFSMDGFDATSSAWDDYYFSFIVK